MNPIQIVICQGRAEVHWVMQWIGITVLVSVLGVQSMQAQSAIVRARILAVAEGRVDEVRDELPTLIKAYPNDPGVLFLSAIVERDGMKALEIYRRIVREHPQSEWADDAYWRIVQYYALIRDTSQARTELKEFQRRYPLSEYVVHATGIVRTSVGLDSGDIAPSSRRVVDQSLPQQGQRYGLQVAAYSTAQAAEQEAKKYREQHLRVDILQKAPTLYAVIIGDYSSRAAAEQARQLVEELCKCTPFIVPKTTRSLKPTSQSSPKK